MDALSKAINAAITKRTSDHKQKALKEFKYDIKDACRIDGLLRGSHQILEKVVGACGLVEGVLKLADAASELTKIGFSGTYYHESRLLAEDLNTGEHEYGLSYHEYSGCHSRLEEIYGTREAAYKATHDRAFWPDGRYDTLLEYMLTFDAEICNDTSRRPISESICKIKAGGVHDIELTLNLDADARFCSEVLFMAYNNCFSNADKAAMAEACATRKIMMKMHK